MTLLILGVVLWCAAHFFKRLAPGPRAAMGPSGKGVIALLILLSVVLMVIGYRSAGGTVYWGRTPAMVGINNLLMLLAFYLVAVAGPKGPRVWIGTKLRHPMLIGFAIWAVAHLLVNGDTPSFILFGGLLLWSLVSMVLINAQDGAWTPPPRAVKRKEYTYVAATLVIAVLVMGLHNYLGAQPWG